MAKQIISDVKKAEKIEKPAVLPEIKAVSVGEKKIFRGKIFYWGAGIIVFLVVFLGASYYFSHATVRITPKQELVNIDLNLEADFETMQMEYEQSQEIMATGSVDGGQKASGIIAIYNTYDSKSQKLVAQTRFESPDGKIYRIQEAVTIPANSSVEAKVYADKQGSEYNIGLVDFTIPGFKGMPSYQKIYGRSKTEMAGGFLGEAAIVTERDLEDARENLKPAVEKYLRENLMRQKPEGYILYADAIKVELFDDLAGPKVGSKVDSQDKKVAFKVKGAATGYLFKKEELSKAVAMKYLNGGEASVARADNIEELNFNFFDNAANGNKLSFNLKGAARVVWEMNKESLLNDLTSAGRSEYLAVFEKYPVIEEAEIVFRPFWWRVISSNPSRIYLEEILTDK